MDSTWDHVTEAQLNLLDTAVDYTLRPNLPADMLHDLVMQSLFHAVSLACYTVRAKMGDQQPPELCVSSSEGSDSMEGLFSLCYHTAAYLCL